MGEQADAKDAKAALSAAIRSALPEMITAAVDAIWSQVPAYASSTDSQLRENATAHVAAVFEVFLVGLTEDRPPRRSDFAFTRQQASRRIGQRISLADYLQAFRVGQLTLWRGVLDAAQTDPQAREAALLLVERIMHVIELGSTVAAEAYVEAQQHQLAEHDRLRRDLIEDLLAYRTTFAGPKRSILRAAGLGPETRLIVASATPTGDAQQTLSAAATAIAGVGRGTGLAAQRQNEIVGVIPLSQADASKAVAGLRRASADPARLAIG